MGYEREAGGGWQVIPVVDIMCIKNIRSSMTTNNFSLSVISWTALEIVVGAFMAIGLIGIPGIFAGIDNVESMPWYLYIAFFGYVGTYILYPIWTI